MIAAQLAAEFEDARNVGTNQFSAKCPGHDDNKASLSISDGDDGRILVHCHAGCSTEHVLATKGMKLADLMPAVDDRPRIVATYDYRNEAGELLYQAVRFDPKDFRQRVPNGKGWVWKTAGVKKVPYRLPELLGADPSLTVFVLEGEKDVNRAADLGLIATCNVGGAGKWRPEYNEALRGRHVVILPDNDEPGRDHAAAIYRQLKGIAASVAIVELPDLPPKGDLSDWLSAGGTKDDLLELIAGRGDAEPPIDVEPLPEKPRFEFISFGDLSRANYQQRFLVDSVLVEGQPGIFSGRSKVLKTSLAIDMTLSLGSGIPFLGTFQVSQCNVGIISGESGEFTIRETALRIAAAKGISPDDCNSFFEFSLPQIGNDLEMLALGKVITEKKLKVCLLDPAYLMLLSADSNVQASNVFHMGALLGKLSKLGSETGCTMILIHHNRKFSENPYDPPELEEMAMAGFAEWARQWMLVGRREEYSQGSGIHKLWLNIGGSAGHSGCYAVDVDEGTLDQHFAGRKWDVSLRGINDVKAEKQEAAKDKKAIAAQRKEADNEFRLAAALRQCPEGQTTRVLRAVAGLNADNFSRAITSLLASERAEICTVAKGKREFEGYKPTERT